MMHNCVWTSALDTAVLSLSLKRNKVDYIEYDAIMYTI